MSFNKHVGPRSDAKTDVAGDRNHLIQIGMAAVWFTLPGFTVRRSAVTLQTGLPTPWWGNAAGLVALTALWAWYRHGPHLPIDLFIPLDWQEKVGKSNGNSTS